MGDYVSKSEHDGLIAELRNCLESAFQRLEAAGADLHPVIEEPLCRMAELLGIGSFSDNAPKPPSGNAEQADAGITPEAINAGVATLEAFEGEVTKPTLAKLVWQAMSADMRAAARRSSHELKEVRLSLESIFSGMDELGLTLHPFIVGEVMQMANILGIDPSTIPTEGRALGIKVK